MGKKLILFITAGVFVITAASNAMAIGIGVYGTIGGGKMQHDYSTDEMIAPSSSTDLAIGGGIILDTNLASNKLFNYRLKIGGEKYTCARESNIDMARVHCDNIFGFGIVRMQQIRWWIGPQVGGFYTTNLDEKGYKPYLCKEFPFGFIGRLHDLKYGGFDIGAATGLNINLGTNFTIGIEGGFKYDFAWGTQKRIDSLDIMDSLALNVKDDMKISGWELYAQVSFMFRFGGDNFRGKRG
jgi:hypothetical protein